MYIKYGKASEITDLYCDDVGLQYWFDWVSMSSGYRYL